MAQWTQTLEPYIKVHEEVKSMALNPTAGEDLIIGVTFISDAGPSTPTLIRGQKEFLETYTSQDLTQEYLESLNQLYTGADKNTALTMWANAYRLAGSNTMLAVRASKADGMYFAKPLVMGDYNTYILRDGELLKKVGGTKGFKLVIDVPGAGATDNDGWLVSISGVGAFGNRTTDDGAQYDYYVDNLPDLVDNLNNTTKFFSPSYKFYTIAENYEETEITEDDPNFKEKAQAVVFDEVYLGAYILDKDDSRTNNTGLAYAIACETEWSMENPNQEVIDLNGGAWSGFDASPYYATNVYNSATPLAIRIRRFNHDAVSTKELSEADKATLTASGPSPYRVLTNVLDTFTANGTKEPAPSILNRDFFEIAVFDPSVNSEVSFFNIGNVLGRGDMEVSELNSLIQMIQVTLPDDLHDLGLNYYGYKPDDYSWDTTTEYNTARWTSIEYNAGLTIAQYFNSTDEMYSWNATAAEASNTTVVCVNPNTQSNVYYEVVVTETTETVTTYDYKKVVEVAGDPTTYVLEDATAEEYEASEHKVDLEPNQDFPTSVSSEDLGNVYKKTTSTQETITTKTYNEVEYSSEFNVLLYFSNMEDLESWVESSESANGNIICLGANPSTFQYFKYNGLNTVSTVAGLQTLENITVGTIGTVEGVTGAQTNYVCTSLGNDQIFAKLTIDPLEYKILSVSDSDLKKAMDKILEDEVYVTEGLCDLGNTELSFQNYLANMAISEDGNYFYPISTVNSTNYMTIGNSATKISQDSYKLYMSTPWDIDTGNLGWKFYASPSVLYWESVARNRRNNNEFASILGQSYGLMQYQRPTTEFNKKSRQLLLSRRVNSVYWNIATQAWNMNDCYTKQNENNIMSEDGNSRLMIRISKAMPVLLRQFIGRKITEKLCQDVKGVIDYWFKTTIIPMNVTVDAYNIICNYDEALARQNKIHVTVQARYSRSLKFIDCFNIAYDLGMEFSSSE